MSEPLDERRRALRESFLEQHGFWAPPYEALLRADPDFFGACLDFSAPPRSGGPLEPVVRELILIAVNAATTHRHAGEARIHIRAALGHGATAAEIMEVLELISVLGIHSCNLAAPILVEELASNGSPIPESRTGHQQSVKADFIARRGYWAPAWDGVLALDPGFLSAYVEFSAWPWQHGVLPPKVKELVYIAVDAAATHLHEIGTRGHIRAALGHGATRAEIMQVIGLVSTIGIQSALLAAPILLEELSA